MSSQASHVASGGSAHVAGRAANLRRPGKETQDLPARAGQRFRDMLALGASQPWQDSLEKLTGTRQMDAAAISDYFRPLLGWLEQENAGRQCGW